MQISVFMNLGILVLQNFIFAPYFCPVCEAEVLVLYKQIYWIFWITVCEKCWQTSCPSQLKTFGQMMHCFWLHWGGWYLNGPKICPVCDIGVVNVSIWKKIPHSCNFWFWITPRRGGGGGGGGAHIWQWNHYKVILYWAINVKKTCCPVCDRDCPVCDNKKNWPIFLFFFYANHPLQGFRSHCSVRGYSSLLVATAGPKPLLGQGDNTHTHTHTHTQPPTQPFITSKHDMKSLLVREQVDSSTVLSTKTKYIQGHSTKLFLPEGTMV